MAWYVVIHCTNGVYEDVIMADTKDSAIGHALKRMQHHTGFHSLALVVFENAYPLEQFRDIKPAEMPKWTEAIK